jgi:prolyl-tRNA editing enzyme YbaK/EbsC (Cys-tRNA(Pro) deacylase)
MSDTLKFVPAMTRLDLVSSAVRNYLVNWVGATPIEEVLVAEINPAWAGGNDFCDRYGFKNTEGANCVIVEGERNSQKTVAAVVIPVGYRTAFNKVVRKRLGARQVSLAPLDMVLKETGMEYGSITPVGLPASWRIFVDERVASAPRIVIGSGLLHSKLSIPGIALLELQGAEALLDLAVPIN